MDGRPTPERRRMAWAILGGAVVAAALLAWRDPALGGYPVCAFRALTGWECAGCGTLRGLHHLLHGHLATAFRLNPLAFVATPLSLFLLANEARIGLGHAAWRPRIRLGRWAWAVPAVIVTFLVTRNLF